MDDFEQTDFEPATEDEISFIKKTITEILSEFLPMTKEEIYRETISCLATEEYFLFTGEQIKDILDSVLAAFDFS